MKTRYVIYALLLTMLFLATPFLGLSLVQGTDHYEVNWGHLKRDNPDATEANVESVRCATVQTMFYNLPGWNAWNAYGADTTKGNLSNTIDWRQSNDVFATDFWVGDFYPNSVNGLYETVGWHIEYQYIWIEELQCWDWRWVSVYGPYLTDDPPLVSTWHQSFYGSGDYTTDINDYEVYDLTCVNVSRQRFTFDWTCACAKVNYTDWPWYGYYDYQYYTGIVGMPLAWTGEWYMNIDGYGSPNSNYCYIGFDGPSFPLMQQVDSTGYNYTSFVDFFYSSLLGYEDQGSHQSIHDALDFACHSIWGGNTDFSASKFYPYGDGYSIYVAPPPGIPDDPPYGQYYNIHMQVIGNSAMILP